MTATATEQSYVLRVDKKFRKTTIMSWLDTNDDFGKLIEVLQKIDLFKGISLPMLIPIANNIQVMSFKLGQLICKDGVEPKGIYFVKRGSC